MELPKTFALADLQSLYDEAKRKQGSLHFAITTESVFDILWDRVQSPQKFKEKNRGNAFADAGYPAIQFNDIYIVAHPGCPPRQLLFFTAVDLVRLAMWGYDGHSP